MRVIVVGAGIAGLAAAHRLQELARAGGGDVDVRLLEASARAGGIVGTVARDGLVLEQGPDSMITDKPWGLALARRLGLERELIGTRAEHRRSFVVREGRLEPVPEGFQLLAPTRFDTLAESRIFSWQGKCRMLRDLALPARAAAGDESLGDFVLRRLGREALDRMAQPMIAGIYGADPMRLSLEATLPRFREMEREHGSVIRGMWARAGAGGSPGGVLSPAAGAGGVSGARYGLFASFRRGMQTLTDALRASLAPGVARFNTPVQALERRGRAWRAILPGGHLEGDAVILAVPARAAARLTAGIEPDLARLLAGIEYGSSATITLVYPREQVPHPLDGFGFVVPASEGLSILGCTFTHVKWEHRAPAGTALLRVFLGGAGLDTWDDAEAVRRARADLGRLLGVQAEPQLVFTWRGPRSMPHYHVGHLDRVAEMERRSAGLGSLALAGNAYRGVGIPDSIHSGERAAESVLADR